MPSNKWIDTYVLPGGYTRSLSELIEAFEVDGLIIEDVFVHEGRNYFMTLEEWRQRFLKNWLEIKRGQDQAQFGRMWHFYLSVARNMFNDELLRHQVAHIVIRKLKIFFICRSKAPVTAMHIAMTDNSPATIL